MKKVMLSVAIVAAIGLSGCKNAQKDTTSSTNKEVQNEKSIALNEVSFGLRGNCGMCKKTIEKAAKSVEGVTTANWDATKKKIDLSFDDSKTTETAVHTAIAASGYDTEKVLGSELAYENLPGCCKYDHAMEMNQSGEVSTNNDPK